MSTLIEDAARIFEVAAGAPGQEPCDLAILVDPSGAIRMVECSGWALASLQAHHGARRAYRIHRAGGRVRIEAKAGSQSCVLESESAPAAARRLLDADRGPLWAAGRPVGRA